MKTVIRPVYYCEFCGRHRLTRSAIEKHEPKCVKNPNRKCGWCQVDGRDLPALSYALAETLDLDDLRRKVDGCPLCMLAAIVLANLTYEARADLDFRYEDEVERFRAEERRGDEGSRW
jgi:hypothetical protein